jgi:hypothetical protein
MNYDEKIRELLRRVRDLEQEAEGRRVELRPLVRAVVGK